MKKSLSRALLTLSCIVALSGCDDSQKNDKITHYSSDKCFVDSIDGKPDNSIYVNRQVVDFAGWAIDISKNTAPEQLTLRLTGIQGAPARFSSPVYIDRPDLVKVYNNPKLLRSGFVFKADLSSLPPGGYGIILEIPNGRSLLVCQVKKTLVVQ